MVEFGHVEDPEKRVSRIRPKMRITILVLTGTPSERGRQQTTGGKCSQGGSYGTGF